MCSRTFARTFTDSDHVDAVIVNLVPLRSRKFMYLYDLRNLWGEI